VISCTGDLVRLDLSDWVTMW
jgi:hypothetical protein